MLDMRIYLQDLLDEVRFQSRACCATRLNSYLLQLVSSRTSAARVGEILTSLERSLAEICIESGLEAAAQLHEFLDLQDAFECNGEQVRYLMFSSEVE